MNDIFRDSLKRGIDEFDLKLSADIVDQLLAYHQLLVKWNKAYNLTSVRNATEMIPRHLLDSLSIASFIEGNNFLDVGTGAGLPGMILAISYPDRQFDLLDSNGKKTRFLFQVKTELGLNNVAIFNTRVEQHRVDNAYDGIFSRAFSTLEDMIDASSHLLAKYGRYYAMKGIFPDQELRAIEKNYIVEASHQLQVPETDAQRHLLVIKNRG